jgi:hypothetical protein
VHFDGTISIGNVLTTISFLVLALVAWRDMNWRVKNLETWRKEHMVDADSRDAIIAKLDKVLDRIDWRVRLKLRDRADDVED